MDLTITSGEVFGALIVALLIVAFLVRRRRLLQTERQLRAFLARYFNGEISLDQLAGQARKVASRQFIGSAEFQSLTQAAFQHAAETRLDRQAHSLEAEKKLLTALAALKSEFGVPDRYQSEGWRPGRE